MFLTFRQNENSDSLWHASELCHSRYRCRAAREFYSARWLKETTQSIFNFSLQFQFVDCLVSFTRSNRGEPSIVCPFSYLHRNVDDEERDIDHIARYITSITLIVVLSGNKFLLYFSSSFFYIGYRLGEYSSLSANVAGNRCFHVVV